MRRKFRSWTHEIRVTCPYNIFVFGCSMSFFDASHFVGIRLDEASQRTRGPNDICQRRHKRLLPEYSAAAWIEYLRFFRLFFALFFVLVLGLFIRLSNIPRIRCIYIPILHAHIFSIRNNRVDLIFSMSRGGGGGIIELYTWT